MPQSTESLWLTLFTLQGKHGDLHHKLNTHISDTKEALAEIRAEIETSKRIRKRILKYLDRWPLFAAGTLLMLANADPDKVLELLKSILELTKVLA